MKTQRFLPFSFLLLIFFFFILGNTGLTEAAIGTKSQIKDDGSQSTPLSIVAEMSDQEVRLMLLDELRKEVENDGSGLSLKSKINGPAGPFARLLMRLSDSSTESETKLQALWDWIPQLPPDLYKTFITL